MVVEKLTLTVDEAAEALGISRNLAYELVKQGKIPTVRMGCRRLVVPVSALQKMLDTACQHQPEAVGAQ